MIFLSSFRKNFTIVFGGIDGVGKTTHAMLLTKRLKEMGIKYKVINVSGTRFSFFLIPLHILKLGGIKNKVCYEIDRFSWLSRAPKLIVRFLIFLDLLLLITFKVKLPSLVKKHCVVYERSPYDVIAELLTYYSEKKTLFFERLLLRFLSADLVIILTVSEKTLQSRRRLNNARKNYSYLRAYLKSYIYLAKDLKLPIFSTEGQSKEIIHEKIFTLIIEKIKPLTRN